MIFQINYQTNKYDGYILKNRSIVNELNYKLFDDKEIDYFLKHYRYEDKFHSLSVYESEKWQEVAIKCDYLRLVILYELGGVYIDIDSIFYDGMLGLDYFLNKKFGNNNVVTENRSLFFIRGVKKSKYIKSLVDIYNNRNMLSYDTSMVSVKSFFNFRLGVRIIKQSTLDKYFYHKPHGDVIKL